MGEALHGVHPPQCQEDHAPRWATCSCACAAGRLALSVGMPLTGIVTGVPRRSDTRTGFGFWGWLDYWSHRLPLPDRVQKFICDRFEKYLGSPK